MPPPDGANTAKLLASANKQHEVSEFVTEKTSDKVTVTKYEAASCSIIMETNHRSRKVPEEIEEIITELWRHTAKSKYEAIP